MALRTGENDILAKPGKSGMGPIAIGVMNLVLDSRELKGLKTLLFYNGITA